MSCQKLASCKPVQIVVGLLQQLGFAATKQLQQQTPDRIGRAAAVVGQLFKRLVANRDDILRER